MSPLHPRPSGSSPGPGRPSCGEWPPRIGSRTPAEGDPDLRPVGVRWPERPSEAPPQGPREGSLSLVGFSGRASLASMRIDTSPSSRHLRKPAPRKPPRSRGDGRGARYPAPRHPRSDDRPTPSGRRRTLRWRPGDGDEGRADLLRRRIPRVAAGSDDPALTRRPPVRPVARSRARGRALAGARSAGGTKGSTNGSSRACLRRRSRSGTTCSPAASFPCSCCSKPSPGWFLE